MGSFLLDLFDVLCLPYLPGGARPGSFKYRFEIKTPSKFLSFTFCSQSVITTDIHSAGRQLPGVNLGTKADPKPGHLISFGGPTNWEALNSLTSRKEALAPS